MWLPILVILLIFTAKQFHLLFWTSKEQAKRSRVLKPIAEIDGGTLANRTSVFLHLEQGLARSFNKPAIISTHQPANHLSELLALYPNNTEEKQNLEADSNTYSSKCNLSSSQGDCLQLSYIQIHSIALEIAASFLTTGVRPGSTMLMLIPNGAEFGLLLWACTLARITISCVDPDTLHAAGSDELRHLMISLKPSLIVVAGAKMALEVDSILAISRCPTPLRVCLVQSIAGWATLFDLVEQGIASVIDRHDLLECARCDDPQRVHSILFTSGSSGRPKGCPMRVSGQTHYMHSQEWLIDQEASRLVLQQAHPSRGIAHLQTLLTWKAGGTVVMTGRGFATDDMVEVLRHFPITFLALSPPMVHELKDIVLKNGAPMNISSVKTVQVGGDAVTKSILLKCGAIFQCARVVVAHGMTEGGGSFQWPFWSTPLSEIPYFGELCPVGVVAPGSVVRVWNLDEKRVCERMESGALHVRSGSLIHHYMFGVSEASFYTDMYGRWFDTGDIAVMDNNGIVFILGRSKDMIKQAGVTIMPAPLENCIEMFTGEQTVIVSATHDRLGSQPFAVLRSFAGRQPNDVKEYIEKELGKHYLPAGMVTLKDLGLHDFPINATHKIVKSEVQKAVLLYISCVT